MKKSLEENKTKKSAAGLRHDQRGAVLAEFVIALVPLLTIFFVFVQISAIAAARLRFKHSAVVAARAAAVLSNKKGTCPDCEDDGQTKVDASVRAALGSAGTKITGTSAQINDRSDEADPYGLVTVTVTGQYQCGVPLGRLICGTDSAVEFTEKKSMPHQGANYKM